MSKVILFDGECNFCNYFVNLLIKYDHNDKFLFAPLNSDFGKRQLEILGIKHLSNDTLVLIEGKNSYIKSDAVIVILRELNNWTKLFLIIKYLRKKLRDLLYDLIAKNRKEFILRKNYCLIPDDKIKKKFIT